MKTITYSTLSIIGIALLALIYFKFFNHQPIANWIFYTSDGKVISGSYYKPESDAATDYPISIPEQPQQDGLMLTLWGECTLKLKSADKQLSISYFKDDYVQAELTKTVTADSPTSLLISFYFYQPDDVNLWLQQSEDKSYRGMMWDNMANHLIPVHYKEDKLTLITGTRYTLGHDSNWLYMRWVDGKLIEQAILDDLAKKSGIITPQDHLIAENAKQKVQKIADNMATEIKLPFKLLLWNNDLCQSLR